MRLKSIDIQGFKSFPDRTQLSFGPGVTAIIGPNGSGKSNIADAVRWVLGEQSTKTLRGGKMEDVIFGGTQTRKAQGAATVTLVIDNADRGLHCDADEVAVSRRLYRSGDSEYRINGAQVRLRDVNELFMDTGLGRDGYSIIGQGRVAEIVSARSRERREIFEEAAGISRFRYRKNEAERRLSLAEENLLRLRDILAEVESRVEPLRQQAEKAKKYLEYAGEKKTLEVSLWVRSLEVLRRRVGETEDKLILARRDHAAAEAEVQRCEEEYAAETEKSRACMAEIERLRALAADRRTAAARTEADAAVERNNIEHYRQTVGEIEEALALAEQGREELLASAEAARQRIRERTARQEALREEMAETGRRIEEAEGERSAAAQEGEALRLRRTGAFEAIESARLDAATSATVLGESETRLGSMDDAERVLARDLEDARKELSDCEELLETVRKEITSLDNTEGGYLLKRQSRQQKLEGIEEKIGELDREADRKRQRARVLSDMEKNMEGFGQSVRTVMRRAQSGDLGGIRGPVSSLIRVQDEYALAVETALGAAVQNVVVENEDAAKRAIDLLRREKAGRATFLPLTSVRGSAADTRQAENLYGYVGLASELVTCDAPYREVVRFLLGRTLVAKDLDCAVVIARKNGFRLRVVSLDGQVVNAGGSMTGGFAVRSAGILGRRREIESLLSEAGELEKKRQELDAGAQELRRDVAALDAETDALEARRKTLEEDRIRAEAQKARLLQEADRAARAAEEAKKERSDLEKRIGEMRERSASSRELAETLSARLEELQKEIADNTEQVAERDRKIAALRESLSEQDTALQLAGRDLEQAREELERVAGSLETDRQEQEARREKARALRQQTAASRRRIGELESRKDASLAEAGEAEASAAALQEKHNGSERRCAELRALQKETESRRDGLYREVVRLDEQRASAAGEQETLAARLYDEYEMTLSDAEEAAAPVPDVPAANRRLAELRGKIKGLGAVHVGAVEEYKEVSARYEELSRQIGDVEHSKKELTRLIGELTGQMRGIFTEKFTEIDRHFRTTFTELFEGGSASLSLTDPGDVLESGIEISVKPPGKLIKNLAALSGGEQAFVAIAIFFAILRVNPAPFCILDEIEAALDDVNVTRFAAYLRRLTDKTQFIAITHRRGTMEEADDLYGVTMQEEGVSRLLRLQVSEIEKTMQTNTPNREDR